MNRMGGRVGKPQGSPAYEGVEVYLQGCDDEHGERATCHVFNCKFAITRLLAEVRDSLLTIRPLTTMSLSLMACMPSIAA